MLVKPLNPDSSIMSVMVLQGRSSDQTCPFPDKHVPLLHQWMKPASVKNSGEREIQHGNFGFFFFFLAYHHEGRVDSKPARMSHSFCLL